MQDHDTSGPKDPHTEILKQRSCTNCPTILIQRSRTSGPIRSWFSGPKDPATEILHKCSYRILIQVVQRIIHTEILKQRSCTSGPGSKASWYEILCKWSYRILIQVVRILIQRSCYKCRADLLSLLVGVRSHTLFGVSCRDNEHHKSPDRPTSTAKPSNFTTPRRKPARTPPTATYQPYLASPQTPSLTHHQTPPHQAPDKPTAAPLRSPRTRHGDGCPEGAMARRDDFGAHRFPVGITYYSASTATRGRGSFQSGWVYVTFLMFLNGVVNLWWVFPPCFHVKTVFLFWSFPPFFVACCLSGRLFFPETSLFF